MKKEGSTMLLQLSVNNQSVDSSGITNDYKEAINEYIWNGFEANARTISINFSHNAAYGVNELVISDDGDGINYDELNDTFGAFLTSKKRLLSLNAKSKINKGKGRFSFIAFANNAMWSTTYRIGNEYKHYNISMSANKKDVVEYSEPKVVNDKKTGTEVVFTNIMSLTVEDLNTSIMEPSLLKEFAWFLYLYKGKTLEILLNGKRIDYTEYVNTELSETAIITIEGHEFEISLIVWQESIREKFCRYYFDSNNVLKYRNTTTFNRNTINFNHSVYVKSQYFDSIDHISDEFEDSQMSFFIPEEDKSILKRLKREIKRLIERKMKIFLSDRADKAIEEMISERKTFPAFSDDFYGRIRQKDLKRVTKEIYKLEPMIFHKLKPVQEKSLLGFLNLLLSSKERENVLTIIEQVVNLSPEQRDEFASILKKTELESIIDTIRFLEDRFRVIEILRSIVFDLTRYANEREHVQKLVEHNFWLFGEQYNLASADQRMKRALEKYINILYGENNCDAVLREDVENERRMDIFLCNNRNIDINFGAVEEENIIVELKAPRVVLSKKVYRQIEDYMGYVIRQPAFNGTTRKWKFIAVCTEVDDDIKSRYKAFEDKGKAGLVYKVDNFEIYALTWDDVIIRFERRYKPLLDKLKYDREKVADEIIQEVHDYNGHEKADTLVAIAVSEGGHSYS